jgi:hypothetical protein
MAVGDAAGRDAMSAAATPEPPVHDAKQVAQFVHAPAPTVEALPAIKLSTADGSSDWSTGGNPRAVCIDPGQRSFQLP